MPPNGSPRVRRWAAALVAVALAAQLAAAAGYLATGGASPGHGPVTAAARQAARVLLHRRADAICGRDRAAFLATVAPSARAYRATASAAFLRLAELPLASCRYRLRGGSGTSGAGRWTARVDFDYRLRGFDAAPVSRRMYLTFGRYRGSWRIVGDGGGARGDAPAIWSPGQGRLIVLRDGPILLIGAGRSHRALRRIDGRARAAIGRVDAVWHRSWARRAVIEAPASRHLARRLAGTVDTAEPAAVATVAPGPGGTPRPGAGDRVVIMPHAFAELSATGVDVVLAHELTHVATRAVTTGRTPVWLVEGFADYVGYRDTGLPVRTVATELAGRVAAGHAPTALPGAAAFAGRHAAAAYEGAWLACRMIARRYGEARLTRLYVAAGRYGPRSATRRVLGVSPHRLTAAWRTYLHRAVS